jgi:hypothetical protein
MSGISGFPSSQKVPLGTGITSNFSTVIPTDPYRNALDVPRFAFRVDSATVPRTAGVTTGLDDERLYWIDDVGTPARPGDFIRCEDGPAQYLEIPIVKVETDRFLIAISQGFIPQAGDTFYILRYATQQVDENGSQIVIATPGPTQFVLDGVDVEVNEDTLVPANNKPLPVKLFSDGGGPIANDFGVSTEALRVAAQIGNAGGAADFGAGATGAQTQRVVANIQRDGNELSYNAGNVDANTQRVVLPSDQPAIPTQSPVNTGGSYDEVTNLDTTPQTFTVPANAVGFILEASSSNNQSIRWKIGAAASATSGMLTEPGRDTGFVPCAANISIAATSGTNQTVTVQWILKV